MASEVKGEAPTDAAAADADADTDADAEVDVDVDTTADAAAKSDGKTETKTETKVDAKTSAKVDTEKETANATSTETADDGGLPDLKSMKAREMKAELESYGVSTKTLFEKSEFEAELKKARAEGKKPKETSKSASAGGASSTSSTTSSSSSSSSKSTSTKSRQERYDEALAQAQGMKVGELKKELQNRGVSTKSFFEKTEFVKAYAEAVADGTQKKGTRAAAAQDEPYDPSYRDVAVSKFDPIALRGQRIIDVQLGR